MMENYNKIKVYDYLSLSKIVAILPLLISKDSVFQPESHNFWEFIYVRSGTLRLTADDKEYALSENRIIFYPPNTVHSWRAETESCTIDVLSFETNSQEMNYFCTTPIKLTDSEALLLSKIFAEASEILTTIPPDAPIKGQTLKAETPIYKLQHVKKQIELFLIEIFNRTTPFDAHELLNRKRLKSAAKINERIIRCLEENVDKNLSLEQIGLLTGISVTHMKRSFKNLHDGGIIDYFILLKIDKAKKLIAETELSFTEISNLLSFSSSAYFSRTFKKKTGLTPSEYLRKVNR